MISSSRPPPRRRCRWGLAGCLITVAVVGWCFLTGSPAWACTPLPDGTVFVQAANFADGRNDPVPANGALLFLVDCPNCTACQAAEKAVAISVWDSTRRRVPLQSFEQIFLRDRPSAHIVVVRPRDRLVPGTDYMVAAAAVGQLYHWIFQFTAGSAIEISDLSGVASGWLTTHRRERGIVYDCAMLTHEYCYPTSIGKRFGSEHQLLPLLGVKAEAPAGAASQLLFRARQRTPSAEPEWRAWRWGGLGESFEYFERHDSYCAEVDVKTVLSPPATFTAEICLPHGTLDAPSLRATDLQAEVADCPVPPFELQAEWCALKSSGPPDPSAPNCATGTTTVGPTAPGPCTVTAYCGPNPKAGATARPAPPDGPASAPEPLCPNPKNPYPVGEIPGCAFGGPTRASLISLLVVLAALTVACLRKGKSAVVRRSMPMSSPRA